jgi:hypothetical protein
MAYSDFTLRKVKQSFGLTAVEGGRFLPEVEPIAPSPILAGLLEDTVPWAIAVGTEKAKSELIIAPAAFGSQTVAEPPNQRIFRY